MGQKHGSCMGTNQYSTVDVLILPNVYEQADFQLLRLHGADNDNISIAVVNKAECKFFSSLSKSWNPLISNFVIAKTMNNGRTVQFPCLS